MEKPSKKRRRNKIITGSEFIFLIFLLIAIAVFFLPLYWAIFYSPWCLVLFTISWFPALMIGKLGAALTGN